MKRELPTDDEVHAAATELFADAARAGRKATLAELERRLGIPHATFYRNYPQTIELFQRHKNERLAGDAPAAKPANDPAETVVRLRRENEDLRRTVHIYAESIRQLTLTNQELRAALHEQAGVTELSRKAVHR